ERWGRSLVYIDAEILSPTNQGADGASEVEHVLFEFLCQIVAGRGIGLDRSDNLRAGAGPIIVEIRAKAVIGGNGTVQQPVKGRQIDHMRPAGHEISAGYPAIRKTLVADINNSARCGNRRHR